MKVLLLFLLSLTLSPALHAAIDLASLVPAVLFRVSAYEKIQ